MKLPFIRSHPKVTRSRSNFAQRNFVAASIPQRLKYMFFGSRPADYDIRVALDSLRSQARHSYQNNPYAKRAVSLMVDNILGSDGILYRATCRDPNGKYDTYANNTLMQAWIDWGKQADIADQNSWHDIQREALTSTVIDGECFVRIIKSPAYKCGIKLQLLESDFCDVNHNDSNKNIRMGIQYDDWGKVLGYYFWTSQPNSWMEKIQRKRVYVSADEVMHIYLKERSSQNRGVSWLSNVLKQFEQLDRYCEAELEAALNGAINVGILEKQQNDTAALGTNDNDSDDGVIINNSDNLTVFEAPNGYTLKQYTNGHPNAVFPAYVQTALRTIAAGLNISYNDLAMDYASVNYSSLRQSALICRDRWQTLQTWFKETLSEDIFNIWLPLALVDPSIRLPTSKIDKFRMHKFICRTWDWVDPQKDINATILALNAGLSTYTQACNDLGLDFQELCIERANDEALIKQYGLIFNLTQPSQIQTTAD